MNFALPTSDSPFPPAVSCQPMLARLIGNLRGFVYRRRHDARWTMDFISERCRDVTGYDPHRFIANASLAFGDLIARPDRQRVDETVRFAVLRRHRVTIDYRLRTAHGALLQVEDRLTPIFNPAGGLVAIEGVIEPLRPDLDAAQPPGAVSREPALAAPYPFHF